MKRGIIIFSFIVFSFSNNLFSQNESFMGLSFGYVMPQGDFASNDFSQEGAGYGTNGFLFTFDGAWFPDDYLGIGGSITFINANIDKSKYKDDVVASIAEKYPDLELPDSTEIKFDLGVWRLVNVMVGPHGTFHAGRFNFDLRALAGFSFVFAPGSQLQIFHKEEQLFSTKRIKKASPNLGFTLGGGIRYALQNSYVIRLTAEYTGTNATFETTDEILIDDEITVITKKTDFPINNFYIGLGIAYHFDMY
jgi:opacity protein-like surface antigen